MVQLVRSHPRHASDALKPAEATGRSMHGTQPCPRPWRLHQSLSCLFIWGLISQCLLKINQSRTMSVELHALKTGGSKLALSTVFRVQNTSVIRPRIKTLFLLAPYGCIIIKTKKNSIFFKNKEEFLRR